MDVTCERCGTEYEFDETLVSDRGTTVKCTNCGHLFKVFRPGTEPSAAPPESRSWTLETTGGGTQQIASLKELQRLITAGEVTADDRISRAGEGQKRLGDIAELATFFAAARPKSVRPPPPPASVRPPTGPTSPRPPMAPPARGKGTMLGMGATAGREPVDPVGRTVEIPSARSLSPTAPAETLRNMAPPPPTQHEPPRRAASVRPPATREAAYEPPQQRGDANEPARRADSSQRVARPESAARSQRNDSTDRLPRPQARERLRVDDDDDDDIPPPPQRSYTGVFLGVVLLAAIGIGGYFGWPTIQRIIAGTPAAAPGAQFLADGDAALARDRDDAYEDAASFYTKALALDEHSARVLTGLSRAHALLAQNRIFSAEELDVRAALEPAAAGEAAALRRQAAGDAEDAREHAESAIRQQDGADAEVALADALRLAGDANAQSRLDRALTLATSPSAEALRVRALLEAQRGGGLAAALASAERAVAEDPGSLRARLLLARAQLAAGNTSAARAQVQAVLDRDATHPDAMALRDRIEAAGGGIVALDAGVVAPPPSTVVVPPPPSTATGIAPSGELDADEHATPPPSTTTGGGAPRGDYETLVHQADAQLENARADRARPLYEAALRQRPGGSEALTGMGFVMLDAGNASGSLTYFRQASSAGYGHAYIGMGSAYRQMHDSDHALEAYESYLARLPTGPEANIARRQADLLRAQGAHGGGAPPPPTTTTTHEEAPPHETDTPVTHESTLPAPRGTTDPPPSDVPALDSEP